MPGRKSILWVEDEIDGLAAHRRFLETQGFTVASAAHGDDALALLRRQPYSVVLLDEQMPGRRGLELIGEIRAIDPAMPVVMVTQSEDEGTLRDAIGIEVDDYLVKPVHPRQILSVVTRLLDGARIRQQRLARDFVMRRSEEHTSELQSQSNLVCRLLLEKKKKSHTLPRLPFNEAAITTS